MGKGVLYWESRVGKEFCIKGVEVEEGGPGSGGRRGWGFFYEESFRRVGNVHNIYSPASTF